MKTFAWLSAALALLPVPARAEVPEVRIARQYSMVYLQFNVIEHEKLIQKHAALLGIPEVKVTAFRFNGPTAMNDALLSDSVDIVGGSPNGMFTLWSRARGTPQEVRAISALVTLPYLITSNDPACCGLPRGIFKRSKSSSQAVTEVNGRAAASAKLSA